MRAMVLLGLNAGMSNTDCAALELHHVNLDAGWLDYPRPMTGIPRRTPTVAGDGGGTTGRDRCAAEAGRAPGVRQGVPDAPGSAPSVHPGEDGGGEWAPVLEQ